MNITFGAFCNEPWREDNRFFGSSMNFIFTLQPQLNILKSKDNSNGSYQWLNSKSFGVPHGLGEFFLGLSQFHVRLNQ